MKPIWIVWTILIVISNSCKINENSKSKEATEHSKNEPTEEVRDISSIWILKKIENTKINEENLYLDIKLNDLSFTGNSFCNKLYGELELIDKTNIKFKNIASSNKTCTSPILSQESLYEKALKKVYSYKIKKDQLFLYDYDRKLILEYQYSDTKTNVEDIGEQKLYDYEKKPIDRLSDIWGLKTMNGKLIDASNGMVLELNIKEKNFMGFASCNRIFGSIESNSDNEIGFSNIGATRKLCQDMSLENNYISNLGKVRTFMIKGLKLILIDESGKVLLQYVKLD